MIGRRGSRIRKPASPRDAWLTVTGLWSLRRGIITVLIAGRKVRTRECTRGRTGRRETEGAYNASMYHDVQRRVCNERERRPWLPRVEKGKRIPLGSFHWILGSIARYTPTHVHACERINRRTPAPPPL